MSQQPEEHGTGFSSLVGIWCGQVKFAGDFDDLPDDLADALGASCNSNLGDES